MALLGAFFFGFVLQYQALAAVFKEKGTLAQARTLSSQTVPLPQATSSVTPRPHLAVEPTIVDRSALLAQGGPLGAHSEDEEYASETISVYVVRPGDTLSVIAEMFNVSPNTIVWANDLAGKKLSEGQTLVILPVSGVRYVVKEKDTLESIATKFKGDVADISEFNGISPSAPLAVGTEIIIPEGEMPAPAVPKKAPAKSSSLAKGYFVWPVAGGVLTQSLHGHNGVDIGAPTGNSVFAAAAGRVILARASGWNGGYGNYVVIAHPNGSQTLYSHLSWVGVSTGAQVSKGDVIGAIGSTGKSTGPHLHFEVRGMANPFAK